MATAIYVVRHDGNNVAAFRDVYEAFKLAKNLGHPYDYDDHVDRIPYIEELVDYGRLDGDAE